MEVISSHMTLDDELGEFGMWYQDGVNMNQFYSDITDDSFFHPYKQGSPVHSIKTTTKFSSQSAHQKHTPSLLYLETDARVPEFETSSTRSLSCSSDDMINHIGSQPHHQTKDWGIYFQKNPLVGIQSEDSVLSSSVVPDMVEAENETFQDLTELLEQEYPLAKASSSCTTPSESHIQVLNIQPCSPKLEDSQPSCSFSVDLSSPSSPPHGMDKRYKEMRRKNNIASKNARVARRDKERQMEERAKQLEEENNVLRIKVRKMEDLAQELKTRLIQSVTRNK